MSQGGYVTLIGFVAREPNLRLTTDGRPVADVRVGATIRYFDKKANEWRDGDTSYYTVNCWRRLAGHAKASLRKGDPVMVKGRFRTHTYQDKQGRIRTEVEIVADTIGHDLSRGIATYMRAEPPRPANIDEDMADGDLAKAHSGEPEDPGAEGSFAGTGAPPIDDPGAAGAAGAAWSGEQVDEEAAVSELNRELDELEEPAGEPLPF